MPTIGTGPKANNVVFRNECNFMRTPDDAPNPMDDSPTINVDTRNNFRRDSGPTSGGSDQPNWIPLPDHSPPDQGQDVQRTMQGLALGSHPQPNYGPGDLSGSGYVNSESSNNDTGLSPNTGNSGSDRPTPNSTTPSESRANLQPGKTSGGTSYETSPASSHAPRVPTTDNRAMSSFFSTQPDYTNISSTGMTPDSNQYMPETPGRDFQVPPGWEMSQQTTGLTPVGEGVFRQLMGLGPMDPMDLGWEGGS